MRRKSNSEYIEVKVARVPGLTMSVTLNGDRTVDAAINAAGLEVKETEIVKVNGEEVEDFDNELENGDQVTLVKNIGAGC